MKHKSLLLAAIIPLLFAGCGSSEESYIDIEVRTFTAEPFVYEYKNSLGVVLISTPYTPVLLTCTNDKSANYKGYQYSYKEKDSMDETLKYLYGTFRFIKDYLTLYGKNGETVDYRLENEIWIRIDKDVPLKKAPYPPAFYEVKTENK